MINYNFVLVLRSTCKGVCGFDDPKEFGDPKYLMIPNSSMIQKEFQLVVWTLIILKSTVIPLSSMVMYFVYFGGIEVNLGRSVLQGHPGGELNFEQN